MKVIIAGGRDFMEYELLYESCRRIFENREIREIVSGCAKGADRVGEKYAEFNKIPIKKFPAEWDKYGKSAGYRRNKEMADYSDVLVAFWNGESKGTKHMIDLATANKLEVHVIKYT
jgi:hypothetical protein